MKQIIAMFAFTAFLLAWTATPISVLAQQNNDPKQGGQQWFPSFREFGQKQFFSPQKRPMPGIGPYELQQIKRLAKQAKGYGFARVQEILDNLQDEINDDEEGEDGFEEEDFSPVEVEDLKEFQQSASTALSALKEELNVPAETSKKTRKKKNLVRSAVKLLERMKRNLDKEIQRREEDEKFRDEEETAREQQMDQEREQRRKFDREQRESFRGGPQKQPGGHQPPDMPSQPQPDQGPRPVFPAPNGDQPRAFPTEPVRPVDQSQAPSANQVEPVPAQPSEPQLIPPMPAVPSSSRARNFWGALLHQLFR